MKMEVALVELPLAAHLFHGNPFFQEKEDRRWTLESPSGTTYSEINHISTDKDGAHWTHP